MTEDGIRTEDAGSARQVLKALPRLAASRPARVLRRAVTAVRGGLEGDETEQRVRGLWVLGTLSGLVEGLLLRQIWANAPPPTAKHFFPCSRCLSAINPTRWPPCEIVPCCLLVCFLL